MRDLLATLLEGNFEMIKSARRFVQRPFAFSKASNMIKVAIGVRRCGKTAFLYQTINALLDADVSPDQILMLNFEDERLLPLNAKAMGQLLDTFYNLFPENHSRCCYFFLDEVHNVPDWHLVVRRFFDTKNLQLYLTGSSSKLLSSEIHTSLRGRALATEIWPYSFKEYLTIQHVKLPGKIMGQKTIDILQKHLLNYFERGGFPALDNIPTNERLATWQSYIDTILLRDIIERYTITQIPLLKYLINSLLKNAATIFSVNKFWNDVKSQGYQISKDTIHLYLSYIQDAFLIFTVPHFAESERIKQHLPKKIYAIDNGFIHTVSLGTNALYGKLFENLIYLDLRRQGKKIYYYRTAGGFEVDFITIDQKGKRECLQVCWDIDNTETLAREQRALEAAQKELKIKGILITPREYFKWIMHASLGA